MTFTLGQFDIEGSGFRRKFEKTIQRTGKNGNKIFKPAIIISALFIGLAFGAQSKVIRWVKLQQTVWNLYQEDEIWH